MHVIGVLVAYFGRLPTQRAIYRTLQKQELFLNVNTTFDTLFHQRGAYLTSANVFTGPEQHGSLAVTAHQTLVQWDTLLDRLLADEAFLQRRPQLSHAAT